MRFSYACLSVPGGQGGKHNLSSLTPKVNESLVTYPTVMEQTQSDKSVRSRTFAKDN